MLLLSFQLDAFSQKSQGEQRGDGYFLNYAYHEAIDHYTTAGNLTLQGQQRLAESYFNTGQYEQAKKIYQKLVARDAAEAEDLFNYAFILRSEANYAEANKLMERFYQKAPNDLRGLSFMAHVSNLDQMLKDQGQFNIAVSTINTQFQEFGTAYYRDKIVFTSNRQPDGFFSRLFNWKIQPFLKLYMADVDGTKLSNPRPFYRKDMGSKWHEGPASFARNGSIMAYTRNHDVVGADGSVKLGIYFKEKLIDGSWSDAQAFVFNNPDYSISHPFLTQDGNTMFFSSDMPGGIGGADIYRVSRKTDGQWGKPVNPGPAINTEGDEFFPFYHEGKDILFFSSNGHYGLGGLDIFLAPRMGDGSFSLVVNAGTPVNSRFDDFAFIMDREMKTGFFSSNREGGHGDDDIWSVEMLTPFVFGNIIAGTVIDQYGKPVPGAQVVLSDTLDNIVAQQTSGSAGRFEFVVDADQSWMLSGRRDGYFEGSMQVITSMHEQIDYKLILEKDPNISLYFSVINKRNRQPVAKAKIDLTNRITGEQITLFSSTTGDTLIALPDKRINDSISYDIRIEIPGYLIINGAYDRILDKEGRYDVFEEMGVNFMRVEPGKTRLEELMHVNYIDFDMYRHTLRAETILELDKIIDVLNENPTMAIEIGSHTDCRGSTQLNQQLSQRRAQTMAEYIRPRISNPRRVTFKGYGRTVLLNECDCYLIAPQFCTEEQHAENRRTEFLITSM
jgi:outer membrane protein OmpA-like peptidoglycan-associated protein